MKPVELNVELVTPQAGQRSTGIGRYVHGLSTCLNGRIAVRMTPPKYLPLSRKLNFLTNFPIGIHDHQPGSIVHFPQIMGCAQMLWHPVRPAVATVHDLGVLVCAEDEPIFNRLDRRILDLHLKGLIRADLILADSEFTRQTILDHLGVQPEKISTVYPGIELETIKAILSGSGSVIERYPRLKRIPRPWLLYVGSELPRKNMARLLEILAEVRKSLPGAHLIKIGSPGGARFRGQTLAKIAALGLEERVLFFEDVPDEDLYLFYRAADVLVHPSKLEGFGFPVLEAFACNLPVVCSDSGSLPEVAGEAALRHPPEDVQAFVAAVLQVLGEGSLREKLVRLGKAQVVKFSWQATAQAMERVYHQASAW